VPFRVAASGEIRESLDVEALQRAVGNAADVPEGSSELPTELTAHVLKGGLVSGFGEVTTSSTQFPLPNVFTAAFLDRLAERDEPPTAGDADVAWPWRIEPIPGHGFGLFRAA